MNQVNLFLLALVCVYGFFGMWAFVVHEFPVEGPKPTAHGRLIVDKLLLWFVLVPLLLGVLYIVLH
jgi:hypothetical protein